ncbi:beta-ketoacyl synthase chain length factor [Roseomonas aerophila]|uniref:Beta-ketoacyl synthase chain length factor n=1 Tax=Teichococcus aerophilus TaxID=1224513 RepID=A0ABR7RGK6_9PROT|nr:beta-ketoacyl synthase chain length factor [Pseudoroseomonas aerophila]MBC9205526.1 beta-ketoacyl synthase chain length factor [Pseudoroseomonas aerophila]
MSGVTCHIGGLALLGPGLPGWAASQAVLLGEQPWQDAPIVVPPPAMLAPTERRRTSLVVRLALAASTEAAEASGLAPDTLETVFASSNGDGAVVGAILETLATPGGEVSPTQFHNSVHNAAAGYWGIGAHSTQPSISIGCHLDSFPLGLLHAAARQVPVLFCAYDAPLPNPLAELQPTEFPFAMACVVTPEPTAATRARLTLRYCVGEAAPAASPWQVLERGNPAARALPLLAALAAGRPAQLTLPLLDGARLEIEVTP